MGFISVHRDKKPRSMRAQRLTLSLVLETLNKAFQRVIDALAVRGRALESEMKLRVMVMWPWPKLKTVGSGVSAAWRS
jgi:hypothetical protein